MHRTFLSGASQEQSAPAANNSSTTPVRGRPGGSELTTTRSLSHRSPAGAKADAPLQQVRNLAAQVAEEVNPGALVRLEAGVEVTLRHQCSAYTAQPKVPFGLIPALVKSHRRCLALALEGWKGCFGGSQGQS
jgi:hypothetical protein